MNVFNRVVMIILIFILVILTAVMVTVPKQVFQWLAQSFDGLGQYTELYLTQQWALFATGRVVIGGAVMLLCLILLWLELRQPRKKTIRAQKTAGGEAHIAVDSIAQRLAYNIDKLPDVVKVAPRILGRSRGVDIDLLLETSPDVDIPMKTEEVLQVTKNVIEEQMGLRLGKVQVNIKHAPYPKE